MKKFIELPASKHSISIRKLAYGKGINDANYIVQRIDADGKHTMCPYYRRWFDMLSRCYSKAVQKRYPTYIGCTVCEEWLLFSNFRKWMECQPWQGNHLDKDIVKVGNQVYCPALCCFTTGQENSLFCDSGASRGKYPTGVHFDKRNGKFVAQCNVNGKKKHLGYFKTAHSAEAHYINFKRDLIIKTAMASSDPRIKNGLLRHANNLVNNPV